MKYFIGIFEAICQYGPRATWTLVTQAEDPEEAKRKFKDLIVYRTPSSKALGEMNRVYLTTLAELPAEMGGAHTVAIEHSQMVTGGTWVTSVAHGSNNKSSDAVKYHNDVPQETVEPFLYLRRPVSEGDVLDVLNRGWRH